MRKDWKLLESRSKCDPCGIGTQLMWLWCLRLTLCCLSLADYCSVCVIRVKDSPHFEVEARQEAGSSLPGSLLHVHCVYTHCGLQTLALF